jgi:hypothetical protein
MYDYLIFMRRGAVRASADGVQVLNSMRRERQEMVLTTQRIR